MPEAWITTSWDDGCAEDFRIADMLAKHQLPGCFYVPRSNPERPVISEDDVRRLGASFEVGGHTLSHLPLTTLSREAARREIVDGKRWLDDVLGRDTVSFCYPRGMFDAGHARDVEAAGFSSARTADWMCLDQAKDVYRIAPSLHVYPHSFAIHAAHCLRRGHVRELARHVARFHGVSRLRALAGAMLDHVEEHGGVFHVWGHGWEIAARGLWPELEAIFADMASRPALRRVDNAALTCVLRAQY